MMTSTCVPNLIVLPLTETTTDPDPRLSALVALMSHPVSIWESSWMRSWRGLPAGRRLQKESEPAQILQCVQLWSSQPGGGDQWLPVLATGSFSLAVWGNRSSFLLLLSFIHWCQIHTCGTGLVPPHSYLSISLLLLSFYTSACCWLYICCYDDLIKSLWLWQGFWSHAPPGGRRLHDM